MDTILNKDNTEWNKEILNEFYTQHPALVEAIVKFEIIKKDDERGYLVGVINIEGVLVPVIVDNYRLYAFDVCLIDGVTIPFTIDTVQTIFRNPSAFSGLRVETGSNDFVDLFNRGLKDIGPSEKKASLSILENLDNVSAEKLAALKQTLNDMDILKAMERNGTLSVIEKLSNIVPKQLEPIVLPNPTVRLVEKIARSKYLVKEFRPGFDHITTYEMTEELPEVFPEAFYKTAEFFVSEDKEINYYPFLSKERDSDGIVITKNGNYVPFNKGAAAIEQFTMDSSIPKEGDYGILKIGNAVTEPFYVERKCISTNFAEIQTFNGLEKKAYQFIKGIDTIIPHENIKNTFYVPYNSSFTKLGSRANLNKAIQVRLSDYVTKLAYDHYICKGPTFDNYKGDLTKIGSFDEIKPIILIFGGNIEHLKKIAVCKEGQRVYIDTAKKPLSKDLTMNKLAEYKKIKFAENNKFDIDLIKEAANVINDKLTVDAILSLKMLTPDNVSEFIQQLPTLEQVSSQLAKLLLMVRLGLKMLPETIVARLVKDFSKVVEGLRRLANVK